MEIIWILGGDKVVKVFREGKDFKDVLGKFLGFGIEVLFGFPSGFVRRWIEDCWFYFLVSFGAMKWGLICIWCKNDYS